MSEPMPFAKIRLSLMFAAEHELPIELGTDEVWSVLNKLDQLSAETGKAIARAEAAEQKLRELQERTRWIPVSERVPHVDGYYLAYGEGMAAEPSIVYFYANSGDDLDATHWMPLPTPPQEAE